MELFLAAAVLGLVVGICSGLLGIGGGVIMLPAFRLIFGMSPLVTTATSLFAIIPTSISGSIARIRNRTCIPKLGVAIGLGGACLSPIGVWLASISPSWLVMACAALVLAYSAISMFQKALKVPRAQDAGTGNAAGNAVGSGASSAAGNAVGSGADGPDTFAPSRRDLLAGLGIGLIAGLISGYIGVGGGFIIVPLLLSLVSLPMKLASGTSLVAVLILAIPGTISQGLLGNIDYLAGIAIACGAIPGALIGARLANRAPERMLRFLFGGFLVIAAVFMIAKETGLIG